MTHIKKDAYSDDIVVRLRKWRGLHLAHGGELFDAAADEIARLRSAHVGYFHELKNHDAAPAATANAESVAPQPTAGDRSGNPMSHSGTGDTLSQAEVDALAGLLAQGDDASSFTAEEIRAVQCGANALRVAANRVGSYDDMRDMQIMADQIEAMLDRLGGWR